MIASVLLFILNRNICNTFYICDRASHREFHGVTVLLAEVVDVLGETRIPLPRSGSQRVERYISIGVS